MERLVEWLGYPEHFVAIFTAGFYILLAFPPLIYAMIWLNNRELALIEAEKSEYFLESILVHPIKSCRGTELKESAYTASGLLYDRRWLVVDANSHKFCTARELPKMVLVEPVIDESAGTLTVRFPTESGIDAVVVPLQPSEEELASLELLSDVTIWSSTTDAYVVGNKAIHRAFSKYLDKEVLLVQKGPSRRSLSPPDQSNEDYQLPKSLPEDSQTAFADGFPFLITSRWSIDHVEEQALQSATGNEQFAVRPPLAGAIQESWASGEGNVKRRMRPNLVVAGKSGKAWEEDTWGVLQVGEQELIVVSLCGRCQLPNIDPATGLPHPSVPYKLLTKDRRVDPVDKYSPCFGVNAIPSSSLGGRLRVGDRVRVVKNNNWRLRVEENE